MMSDNSSEKREFLINALNMSGLADEATDLAKNVFVYFLEQFLESGDDLANTKGWLEGWVCGVTDPIIHPELSLSKDKLMDMLEGVYDGILKFEADQHTKQ
jgi:hypothetical protein